MTLYRDQDNSYDSWTTPYENKIKPYIIAILKSIADGYPPNMRGKTIRFLKYL